MRKSIATFFFVSFVLSCTNNQTADKPLVKETSSPATNTASKNMQAEFADAKFMDMGKQMMRDFESGNIDAYGQHMADNVVYNWSSGDSLVGKAAVVNYWKERRAKVIQSLSLSNDIWLPIKVNQPQKGPDMPGVWLMNWHQVNVTFRNGKSLQFWTHIDHHYDANNKVDRIIQYIDRAPIMKALEMK